MCVCVCVCVCDSEGKGNWDREGERALREMRSKSNFVASTDGLITAVA